MSDNNQESYPIRDLEHMYHLVELAKEAETEYLVIPRGLTRKERRLWAQDKAKVLNQE